MRNCNKCKVQKPECDFYEKHSFICKKCRCVAIRTDRAKKFASTHDKCIPKKAYMLLSNKLRLLVSERATKLKCWACLSAVISADDAPEEALEIMKELKRQKRKVTLETTHAANYILQKLRLMFLDQQRDRGVTIQFPIKVEQVEEFYEYLTDLPTWDNLNVPKEHESYKTTARIENIFLPKTRGDRLLVWLNYRQDRNKKRVISHHTNEGKKKRRVVEQTRCDKMRIARINLKEGIEVTDKVTLRRINQFNTYISKVHLCVDCNLMKTEVKNGTCEYCTPGSKPRKVEEEKVANALKLSEVIFQREQYITYKCMNDIDKKNANLDFVIELKLYRVILEVDEHQHKHYQPSCELSRMMFILEATQENKRPLLFIRYNPHAFKQNGVTKRVPTKKRFEVLLNIIRESTFDTFALVYLFYDCDDQWIPQVCKSESYPSMLKENIIIPNMIKQLN